jgi:hypothetical protein
LHLQVFSIEQSRRCESLYDHSLFEKLSMTTAELGLATKSAATLSTSTAMKEVVFHGPGKRAWEDKPRPAIRDPGDAIVRITTSRRGSKASWALSSLFPLPANSPSSKLRVMSVTSIGDLRHGGSTELQATIQTIEA